MPCQRNQRKNDAADHGRGNEIARQNGNTVFDIFTQSQHGGGDCQCQGDIHMNNNGSHGMCCADGSVVQ